MNTTHLRRAVVAVATAVACLVTLATPSGAVLLNATINGGQFTFVKTGVTETIPLTSTGACGTPTLVTSITGTVFSMTVFSTSQVTAFAGGGSYLSVFTRSTSGNSAGTIDTTVTPHVVSNKRIAIVSTVYNTTGCTPTGTPVCTVAFILNLSGTGTSTTTGSSYTLSGGSVGTVVAFPTCAAGPSQLLGTTVTPPSSVSWTFTP